MINTLTIEENYIDILEGGLDSEEQRVYRDLLQMDPAYAERFLAELPRARHGIMHRLLMGIIRENLLGLELGACLTTKDHPAWRPRIDDMLAEIRGFGYEPVSARFIPLTDTTLWVVPVSKIYSLDRFELEGDVHVVEMAGGKLNVRALRHPLELLMGLRELGLGTDQHEAPNFERFYQEIQNSVANFALALAGFETRVQSIKEDAERISARTSLEYVRLKQAESADFSPLVYFEQIVVEGHPLHPGAKIKMGMTTEETIRYSPELGARPQVRVVAVRRDHVGISAQEEGLTPGELLYRDYPELEQRVQESLMKKGVAHEDYQLITLHPWQFENTVMAGLYDKELAAGIIVPIENFVIDTGALMSFRSLAPAGRNKHHIKTCVNVQMTGAIRTISPNSAQNGPRIANVIHQVMEYENRFDNTLYVMEERVGIHFASQDAEESEKDKFNRGKNLASIIRQNPEWFAEDGEIAIVGSGLIATSPVSGEPVVLELIKEFAAKKQIDNLQIAVSEWFKSYSSVALPGFLQLMSRYGISLEGHLQNCVPVFKHAELTKMVVRDFGGVRIQRERMRKRGLQLVEYPGSATIVDDVRDMRNKTFYPLFQNHIGELIFTISKATGCNERILWDSCIAVAYGVFQDLMELEPDLTDQVQDDMMELFAEDIELKSMTAMRLQGTVTDYTFSRVPNPLDPKGRFEQVVYEGRESSVFIKFACCKKFKLEHTKRCTGCPGLCQVDRRERLYKRIGITDPAVIEQIEHCPPDSECAIYSEQEQTACKRNL